MNTYPTINPDSGKMSIAECRKILTDKSLTDEQVVMIRDFLCRMVLIELQVRKQLKEDKTTNNKKIKDYDTTKSISLYPRQHRRAA